MAEGIEVHPRLSINFSKMRKEVSVMDKYRPPSPYIEHVFRCSLTGRDPNPDEKRYERLRFWDEIIESHVRSTEAAIRTSQEIEAAIRQAADENKNNENNIINNRKEQEP